MLVCLLSVSPHPECNLEGWGLFRFWFCCIPRCLHGTEPLFHLLLWHGRWHRGPAFPDSELAALCNSTEAFCCWYLQLRPHPQQLRSPTQPPISVMPTLACTLSPSVWESRSAVTRHCTRTPMRAARATVRRAQLRQQRGYRGSPQTPPPHSVSAAAAQQSSQQPWRASGTSHCGGQGGDGRGPAQRSRRRVQAAPAAAPGGPQTELRLVVGCGSPGWQRRAEAQAAGPPGRGPHCAPAWPPARRAARLPSDACAYPSTQLCLQHPLGSTAGKMTTEPNSNPVRKSTA